MTLNLCCSEDNPEQLWKETLWINSQNKGNGGVLCLALARVAAETRFPFTKFGHKSGIAAMRKHIAGEIRRGELAGDFHRYIAAEMRY